MAAASKPRPARQRNKPMKSHPIPLWLSTSLLLAFAAISNAVQASPIISLSASTPVATVGDYVSFELWMDFTGDPTLGGDIAIDYVGFTDGNQLSFTAYTPYLGNPDYQGVPGDPTLTTAPWPNGGTHPSLVPPIDATSTGITGIAFGDLDNGIDGYWLVGSLTFLANVAGDYSLVAKDGGGFYAMNSNVPTKQLVQYDNTQALLNVQPSTNVPLPSTAWLFLGGLIAAAAFSRPRRT